MSEFALIDRLHALLLAAGAVAPPGGIGIGDDAAVLAWPGGGDMRLLVCADAVVAGVHADLSLTGLDDLGWKALATNLSDIAAMGGVPTSAVVTVASPPGCDVELLYRGIAGAAAAYGCPVVGGDVVSSPTLVVSVAVTGVVDGPAVARSGARAGDGIWVTGALGGAAAGLRLLRADPATADPQLVAAHARPRPRLREGEAARRAGASAMIDVSDGFTADLGHLLDASGVAAELDDIPVRPGATLAEACGGGDDYELVITAPEGASMPGVQVGTIVTGREPGLITFDGQPLPRSGWLHEM